MKDEQIKQNAANYYEHIINDDTQYRFACNCFVAGAHSRDKEIKELEQALAFAEDVVDAQKKGLDQLRNPWIGVEDMLPDEFKIVIVMFDSGIIINAFVTIVNNKPLWHPSVDVPIDSNVIFWMPIPQLKET